MEFEGLAETALRVLSCAVVEMLLLKVVWRLLLLLLLKLPFVLEVLLVLFDVLLKLLLLL